MPERRKNEPAPLPDRDAKPVKAPYTTPALRTFGAVNQLTTGAYSGQGFDMGTMRYFMY
jgi:hypothetical protein